MNKLFRSGMHFLFCISATVLSLAHAAEITLPPQTAKLIEAKGVSVLPVDLDKAFTFEDFINPKTSPGKAAYSGKIGAMHLFTLENAKGSANYDGIRVSWANSQAVKKGDVMLARFAARANKARQESGEAEGMFYFRRIKGPSERTVQSFSVGQDWTIINAPFVALDDAEVGESASIISFGNLEQTIEIAGLEVVNFQNRAVLKDLPTTRFTYAGRDANCAWRTAALARIEEIRTSPLTIKIHDAKGNAVEGAKFEARLIRPEFLWGSSVSAERIMEKSADAERYRKEISQLFDTTVIENGLKWPRWREPAYRARALDSLDWLLAQNKRVKGHNLAWPGWKFSPKDIANDPERGSKISALVKTHIQEITSATKGKLIGWDVVNEPVHETDYFKYMPKEEVADWFKLAEKSDPKLQLTINEYGMLNRSASPLFIADYLNFVRMLRKQGARIDVLGVQGHVGQTPRPPSAVLSDLDLLSADGDQVQITEYDFNTPDEELQADYTRDFLIALYSHKAVTGFIQWGFWQGEHWKPDAAMYRRDWSEKPNLKVWKEYVLGKWKTSIDSNSNAGGEVAIKGHHGHYTATVSFKGQTKKVEFDLNKKMQNLTITLD